MVQLSGGRGVSSDEEAFNEAKYEFRRQVDAGELDIGADESSDGHSDSVYDSRSPGPASLAGRASCLAKLAASVGVLTDPTVVRVVDIPEHLLTELRRNATKYKVWYCHKGVDDPYNHVEAVGYEAKTARIVVRPLAEDLSEFEEPKTVAVTSFGNFFAVNADNPVARHSFYADKDTGDVEADLGFGEDLRSVSSAGKRSSGSGEKRGAAKTDATAAGIVSGAEHPTVLPFGEEVAGGSGGFFHPSVRAKEHPVGSGYNERGPRSPGVSQGAAAVPGVPSGGVAGPPGAPWPRAPSVVDEAVGYGASNVSGGVTRRTRRVVVAVSRFTSVGVKKGYVASVGVKFNNLKEMYQDAISREYAQEILEDLFESWGVPATDADAMKFSEDLVWAFIVAVTASNKANYEKVFVVSSEQAGEVDADFSVFSKLLAYKYGVTRRQFARSVANDIHEYLEEPENVHVLPDLATRAGCDPQMASYAFDGSTHCSGMTSAQTTFTKLLETRNLFEDDAVLADGASGRLMAGMSTGVRSKVQR